MLWLLYMNLPDGVPQTPPCPPSFSSLRSHLLWLHWTYLCYIKALDCKGKHWGIVIDIQDSHKQPQHCHLQKSQQSQPLAKELCSDACIINSSLLYQFIHSVTLLFFHLTDIGDINSVAPAGSCSRRNSDYIYIYI